MTSNTRAWLTKPWWWWWRWWWSYLIRTNRIVFAVPLSSAVDTTKAQCNDPHPRKFLTSLQEQKRIAANSRAIVPNSICTWWFPHGFLVAFSRKLNWHNWLAQTLVASVLLVKHFYRQTLKTSNCSNIQGTGCSGNDWLPHLCLRGASSSKQSKQSTMWPLANSDSSKAPLRKHHINSSCVTHSLLVCWFDLFSANDGQMLLVKNKFSDLITVNVNSWSTCLFICRDSNSWRSAKSFSASEVRRILALSISTTCFLVCVRSREFMVKGPAYVVPLLCTSSKLQKQKPFYAQINSVSIPESTENLLFIGSSHHSCSVKRSFFRLKSDSWIGGTSPSARPCFKLFLFVACTFRSCWPLPAVWSKPSSRPVLLPAGQSGLCSRCKRNAQLKRQLLLSPISGCDNWDNRYKVGWISRSSSPESRASDWQKARHVDIQVESFPPSQ